MNTTRQTIHTYDCISDEYYQRWKDRSAIKEHIDRFSAMIKAYGLQEEVILDVGCGPGFDAGLLLENGLKVVGIDLSMGMLRVGKDKYPVPFTQADMRALPVAAQIGGLWVSASILHLTREDTKLALQHFAGILIPGGLLYLSLKVGDGASWNHNIYQQPRYFTYWQPEDIDQIINKVGLIIIDSWQGEGVVDEWLIRFARKPILSTDLIISV